MAQMTPKAQLPKDTTFQGEQSARRSSRHTNPCPSAQELSVPPAQPRGNAVLRPRCPQKRLGAATTTTSQPVLGWKFHLQNQISLMMLKICSLGTSQNQRCLSREVSNAFRDTCGLRTQTPICSQDVPFTSNWCR